MKGDFVQANEIYKTTYTISGIHFFGFIPLFLSERYSESLKSFTLGVDLAIFRIYYDYNNDKDRRDLLGTIFIFLLIASGIFVTIYFIFQDVVTKLFVSIEFFPYFAITIGYTFLNLFAVIPLIYFQIKHKSKTKRKSIVDRNDCSIEVRDKFKEYIK